MKPMSFGDYFVRRWKGQVRWPLLLWRDMLGVGTAVNLAATLLALIAAIQHAPTLVVALVHFAPVPYNLFLFTALWRTPQRPPVAATIALGWLIVVTLV
jgi:hypothetical protein